MSQNSYPVTVAVRRPDGSVEQVRVGTATKTDSGFSLQLGELSIGGAPVAPSAARAAAPSARPAAPGELPTTLPNYGRSKGQPIAGASMQDLEYYINGSKRSLNDPSKSRWHDKERQLLAALEQELARQGGGGGPGGGDGPPLEESGPEAESDDTPF
jgi:hypothetical protein